MRESLNSRRLKVINSQINDIHDDVASLSESLVDRDPKESLDFIDFIRVKLNILKEQVTHGDIV